MKSYQYLATAAVAAIAMAFTSPCVRAEAANKTSEDSAPSASSAPKGRHLKLCAMLGLEVGRTYEFVISNNTDVHYWTVRSLGAKGWILAKDSRYPATWVNLSQVIAVSPVNFTQAAERAVKPNRRN